jgi:hypothetical protein
MLQMVTAGKKTSRSGVVVDSIEVCCGSPEINQVNNFSVEKKKSARAVSRFFGQPLLLLDPLFFLFILFFSTTLLTGMTGISLHVQWPLHSRVLSCYRFRKKANKIMFR